MEISPESVGWTTFKLDKLVRDHLFEDMLALGQRPSPANGRLAAQHLPEYFERKVKEELAEYETAGIEQRVEEAADVLAAWDSFERFLYRQGVSVDPEQTKMIGKLSVMMIAHEVNIDLVRIKQDEKRDKSGEFDAPYYVNELSVRRNDKWHAYYAKYPNLYPIVKTWQESI